MFSHKMYLGVLGFFLLQSLSPASSEYAVRMSVSEESRAVLSRFSSGDFSAEVESDGGKGSVQDVFFALEAMMVQVELIQPEQLLEEEAANSRFGWIKENLTLYNILLVSKPCDYHTITLGHSPHLRTLVLHTCCHGRL